MHHVQKKSVLEKGGGREGRRARTAEKTGGSRAEGPSALRPYSPPRTALADAAPSASRPFFCAIEVALSADTDYDDDDVEAKRRVVFLRSRARNVVDSMPFCFVLLGKEGR
jgi:hypothetical protein